MTEIEFRNSAYREQLATLLASEPLKSALEIVRSIPSAIPLAANGAHHSDAVLARILAESVGVNKAISRLHLLAEKPQQESEIALDSRPDRPYGFDYLPEPLKEYMREQYRQQQATP